MKFKLENFKPVKSVEIKVNDLTLFFGDNNTGKTYIAYALYGLLAQWDSAVSGIKFFSKEQEQVLRKHGRLEIKKNDLDKNKILKNISNRYVKSMPTDVFSISIKQNNTHAELSDIDLINNEEIKIQIGADTWLSINIDEDHINIIIDGDQSFDFILVEHFILRTIFNIPNVFISVSERLGISLFQKDLDENMANVLEHLKKGKDLDSFKTLIESTSRYTLPIKDNIDFMRAIERHQKEFSKLPIDLLLMESIFGSDEYGGRLKHNGTEIRFSNDRKGDNKMDIPLHLASASVRTLSNLYFFLKHKAKAGDLIIIDEPESHLSLAKQRLLAKLIADCIHNGLKILLTTHSDTLVLELNNLIMLNNEFDDKDAFMNKHEYQKNHIIDHTKVSAYIAESGGVSECKIDKEGMEVESMDEAIDEINTVRDGLEMRIDSVYGQVS